MANTCVTCQAFCSYDKELLEELYSKISENFNSGKCNIAEVLDVSDQKYQHSFVADIREVSEASDGLFYFEIVTDDAWSPHFEATLRFIEDYEEDIWLEYLAEECGMELYCKQSNNIYLTEYRIGYEGEDMDYIEEIFDTEEELLAYAKENFNLTCSSFEELDSLLREVSNEDYSAFVYEFEEVAAYGFAPYFVSKTTTLINDIEQFMFERGEYDYEDDGVKASETPEILAENRELTAKGIEEAITNGDCSMIIDYLENEITVMDKEDELYQKASTLLDRVKPYYTKEDKEITKKKSTIERD